MRTLLIAVGLLLSSAALAGWVAVAQPWLPLCDGRGGLGSCLAGVPGMGDPAVPGWQSILFIAALVAAGWTAVIVFRGVTTRRFQLADYLAGLNLIAITTLMVLVLAWPSRGSM